MSLIVDVQMVITRSHMIPDTNDISAIIKIHKSIVGSVHYEFTEKIGGVIYRKTQCLPSSSNFMFLKSDELCDLLDDRFSMNGISSRSSSAYLL